MTRHQTPRPTWVLQACRRIAALLALVLAVGLNAAADAADSAIGAVDTLKGEALIIREGSTGPLPATPGTAIYQQDIIQTMPNGRVKIRFVDDTVVFLGSDGTLKITEFIYSPEKNERRGRMAVPQGIFRTVMNVFVPNTSFEVTTATAVASVRGTDWITHATAEETTALCVAGEVAFRSADSGVGGEIALLPGQGTTVAAGAAPEAPGQWPQSRVREFVEQTRVE